MTERPLRILCYVQHLSGVGHFMRMLAIARELARAHTVWLTQGGIAVPVAAIDPVHCLPLPPITRERGTLHALPPGTSLSKAWRERALILAAAVETLAPDVVVVEHYPFSKWELEQEIVAMLAAAARRNPLLRRVCSVRDLPLQTRHEAVPPDHFERAVLERLHAHFDGLMVHADPHLCTLHDSFGACDAIRVPIVHTGIVAMPAEAAGGGDLLPAATPSPFVVASVGGGRDALQLLDWLTANWPHIRRQAGMPTAHLAVFEPLREHINPPAVAPGAIVQRRPFSTDYPRWLRAAAASISCAGYNTCADLLATQTPAVLLPNPAMSDQARRAALLDGAGLAVNVPAGALSVAGLAAALVAARAQPRARTAMNLAGAAGSRRFIEQLYRC